MEKVEVNTEDYVAALKTAYRAGYLQAKSETDPGLPVRQFLARVSTHPINLDEEDAWRAASCEQYHSLSTQHV